MYWFVVCCASGLGKGPPLYWFNPHHKTTYKGMGNQLWERSTATALYRMAEAVKSYDGRVAYVLGNFVNHAHSVEAAPSESCMFDIASLGGAAATWEDVAAAAVPVYAESCDAALHACRSKQLVDHESNATHLVVRSHVNRCFEASPDEVCARAAAANLSFAWIGSPLPCVRPYEVIHRPADPQYVLPMTSPYFVDRWKQRYCGDMARKRTEYNSTEKYPCYGASYHPESGLPESTPVFHDTLVGLDLSPLVRRLARRILSEVFKVRAASDINAAHVRRGDRLHAVWQTKLMHRTAGDNCTSCDTCLHRCNPTDDNVANVGRNFSKSMLPVWIATDDDSTAWAFNPATRRGATIDFVGLRAPAVVDLLASDAEFNALPTRHHRSCAKAGLDVYFLVYADSALFDLPSTFSAIAYRKREALQKTFQFW